MQAEVFSRCGIPSNDIMLHCDSIFSFRILQSQNERTAPKKVLEDSGRDAVPWPSV